MILEYVLNKDSSKIFFDLDQQITSLQETQIKEISERHKLLEPLEYILGYAYFYENKFKITKDVLIPRSETEILVEQAIKLNPSSILEIGTGSGCIIASLAKKLPTAQCTATDISEKALQIAQTNALELGLVGLKFIQSDLLSEASIPTQNELIIANLPYVDKDSYVSHSTRMYEPELALFSSQRGLGHIQALLNQIKAKKHNWQHILLEFGYGQEEGIELICKQIFPSSKIKFFQDFNQITRFCHLKNLHV